ncbi:MAG: hypothetical protein ACKVQB_07590, partial [Bacteroidia bacterium]
MQKIIKYLFFSVLLFGAGNGFSQTQKFNIQTSFPTAITVCGKSDSLVFEIRNISSSSISNVFLTLRLPSGGYYQSSSIKGAGVTESNVTNLNAPIFKLPNFTLAGYLKISVKINSNCNLQVFISKGNQAAPSLDFTYTGGSETNITGSLNVNVPNVLINTISNQVKNAYLNNKFIREVAIKNTGKGGAANVLFYRTNGAGLKVTSSRAKDKYA